MELPDFKWVIKERGEIIAAFVNESDADIFLSTLDGTDKVYRIKESKND